MKKRITRPPLKRNAPVRTWSTLFGAQANGQEPSGKSGQAPSGASNAVQKGVELAYRVSDEYLRQGQAFARALSQPLSASKDAGNGASGDLPQLTERMLRYTSELSTMWMEGLRMMSGGMLPGASPGSMPGMAAPSPWPGTETASARPTAAPASPPPEARSGVTLEIDSKLRVRASIDVDASVGRSIAVRELKMEGGSARIRGVRVEEGPGARATVVVRVPPRQAPGTYRGEVVDAATSAPVGTVTVRVSR